MRQQPSSLNRQQIVRAIHRHGPISRIEIAQRTGLSAPTVGEVSGDLLSRGLVAETPDGRSPQSRGRGRPRVLLEIAPDGTVVVAASVTWQGALEVSFVNLAGELLHGSTRPIRTQPTLASLADELGAMLHAMIEESPFAAERIARTAIALPGAVDSRNGLVRWLPTIPDSDIPFAARVQNYLSMPVTIESDLESMARARYWFSDRAAPGTFMLLYVGTTVGAAHYADNAPRKTANAISEFGHVKTGFGEEARRCFCGGVGCLSTYSSIAGLLGKVAEWHRERGELQQHFVMLDRLMTNARQGDAEAVATFDEAGRHLGIAVANHINVNDPGHVILQTSIAGLAGLFEPSFRRTLTDCTLPFVFQRTSFHVELAPDDWRWKGAAALALEQVYSGANTGKVAS